MPFAMEHRLRRSLSVLAALLVVVAMAPVASAQQKSFAWPDGRKAAVSLAYDDALDSQLDHAIPALDKHGMKGSFYLQLSREPVRDRLQEWRAAAANGHELGNHTLFHQCSGSLPGHEWVEPQRDLDKIPVAQMKDQVRLANVMLNAIDGKTRRTMTVPCGDVMAMDGNYVKPLAPKFVAIKLGRRRGNARHVGAGSACGHRGSPGQRHRCPAYCARGGSGGERHHGQLHLPWHRWGLFDGIERGP